MQFCCLFGVTCSIICCYFIIWRPHVFSFLHCASAKSDGTYSSAAEDTSADHFFSSHHLNHGCAQDVPGGWWDFAWILIKVRNIWIHQSVCTLDMWLCQSKLCRKECHMHNHCLLSWLCHEQVSWQCKCDPYGLHGSVAFEFIFAGNQTTLGLYAIYHFDRSWYFRSIRGRFFLSQIQLTSCGNSKRRGKKLCNELHQFRT